MTTARYFTPAGRSIQAEGIVPDIPVEPLKVTGNSKDSGFEVLTEADLSGHLDNPNASKDDKKETEQEPAKHLYGFYTLENT